MYPTQLGEQLPKHLLLQAFIQQFLHCQRSPKIFLCTQWWFFVHHSKWALFGWTSCAVLPQTFWLPACRAPATTPAGEWHGDLGWGLTSTSMLYTWFSTGSGPSNTSVMGFWFEAIQAWKRHWGAGRLVAGAGLSLWPNNCWIWWDGGVAGWVMHVCLFCHSRVEGVAGVWLENNQWLFDFGVQGAITYNLIYIQENRNRIHLHPPWCCQGNGIVDILVMVVKVVWEECEKVQHQQFVMVVVVAQLQVQEGFEVMLCHKYFKHYLANSQLCNR